MSQELGFHPDGWHAKDPHTKCCKMPFPVKENEADLYKKLLNVHCAHPEKETGDHACCGAMTITEKSVTYRCSKCGDSKGVFPKTKEVSK